MIPSDVKTYKKIGIGVGVTSAVGLMFLEYKRFQKRMNNLISPDVLKLESKNPDYIYLKYHIYKESMERRKYKELESQKWVNVLAHPIGNWWKTIKHSIAWRLLEVAKNGDYHDRLKAVRQLAQIDHLKDWDYQHLAQMCNARTAISLARNFSDIRWFLPPANFGALREPKSLISDINEHFSRLKSSQCLSEFNSTVFDNFSILKGYKYSKTLSSSGVAVTRHEYEFLRKCLEALFHLTQKRETVEALIEDGFLQTLMEILKLFHADVNLRFLLAKIIANFSMCHENYEDFFVTGWIGVLARWTHNPDIRVQATAAKALANLDIDDTHLNEYRTKVYPLYPLIRSRLKPQLDVIFIHGLLGGVFVTWRQKDPKEPDLGLYGKNNRINPIDITDSNEIYHIDIRDDYDNTENEHSTKLYTKSKFTRPNIANVRNVFNSVWMKEMKTITYTEDALVSKKPKKEDEIKISDVATKEFLETLKSSDQLESDWEVVFPDCPIKSSEDKKGVFSVSGDKWINDDQNTEYTFCWPMDWLPQEYPNIRIIGLNYETSISEWSLNLLCSCEKLKSSLHDRAEEFLNALSASNVGRDGPIVWVGHSMGGLVAKSIIVQSLESADPKTRQIGENTRAILFLGTPHKGSPVAKLKQHVQMIFSPSIEVKELREGGQLLLNLQQKFDEAIKMLSKPIKIVSIAEGCPTTITAFKLPLQFVTEESAKLDTGEFYVLNVDHLGLSKPIFRQSFLYQRLLKLIDDVIESTKRDTHEAATRIQNHETGFEKLTQEHDAIM